MEQRELVLNLLIEINEEGRYYHTVLSSVVKELSAQDRAFVVKLCTGCVERKITIDMIIDMFSKTKVNKMKPIIRNILRMGVYQIVFMDRVPDSAACNEAVKLAKKRGFSGLSGFVNGVLRNITRSKGEILDKKENSTEIERMMLKYSVPEWLLAFLLKNYDATIVEKTLGYFLEEKKTAIRCNLSHGTVAELVEELEKQGIKTIQGKYIKEALYIEEFDGIQNIKAFKEGKFQMQDESSMLVGKIAGIKQGDFILDLCAAPGGKSLHCADILHVEEKGIQTKCGHVEACDISEYKVNLIDENIKRSGLDNITTRIADATIYNEEFFEKADVVIADIPCSGLGIIGRKPDIKYNMNPEQMIELEKLQKIILKNAAAYVKKGGALIFSTCTLNPGENIGNVSYIKEELKLEADSIDKYLPAELHSDTTKLGYLQIVPGVHGIDGFFISRFVKSGRNNG